MNEVLYILLALFIVFLNIVAVFLIIKKFADKIKDIEGKTKEPFLMLQQQIDKIRDTVDEKISLTTKTINQSIQTQLAESSKIVKEVTHELTKLAETNKQVINFTEQLKKLEETLTNPKQRGVLGEYYLEHVLSNVLPPDTYKMQYKFNDGTIVDAAIFVQDKIIPVDSKFTLENYNAYLSADSNTDKEKFYKMFINDIKSRIIETSKYIKPHEKTTDFAFMFIPSEAIYYDLLTNKVGSQEENIIHYSARKYKVIIISPTSFFAYLQTVLQGLKALAIEKKAQDIIKNVEKLGMHLKNYDEYYKKLGNHLNTVVNTYKKGYKELEKVDKDVLKITGSNAGIEMPMQIDSPNID